MSDAKPYDRIVYFNTFLADCPCIEIMEVQCSIGRCDALAFKWVLIELLRDLQTLGFDRFTAMRLALGR